MARNIHNEDVTDPTRRTQSGLARRHLPHELVGMQASFHQELALRLVDQFDRLGGRRFAACNVDDLILTDIETMLPSHRANLLCRADKDRHDDAGFGGFNRPAERAFVTRVGHDGSSRRHLLRSSHQPFIFRGRRVADRANRGDASDLVFYFAEHVHLSTRAGKALRRRFAMSSRSRLVTDLWRCQWFRSFSRSGRRFDRRNRCAAALGASNALQ